MRELKMSKLYTTIITTILLCATIFSGNVYAEQINERYSYDSSIADEAFEYGELYNKDTFPGIVENDMKNVYQKLLTELENRYGKNTITFRNILIEQIKDIDSSYSPSEGVSINDIENKWLNGKEQYAKNNLTVHEYMKRNNDGTLTWNNDFYNNWHLLCDSWGKSIETQTVKFKKVSYEYATPSMSFIMNVQADGKGYKEGKQLKNATLHEYLTDETYGNDTKKVDLNNMEATYGSGANQKWGLLGKSMATYQQLSNWMQTLTTEEGSYSDGKLNSQNTGYLGQWHTSLSNDTRNVSTAIANMTSANGVEGYQLGKTAFSEIYGTNWTQPNLAFSRYFLGIATPEEKLLLNIEAPRSLNIENELINKSILVYDKNGNQLEFEFIEDGSHGDGESLYDNNGEQCSVMTFAAKVDGDLLGEQESIENFELDCTYEYHNFSTDQYVSERIILDSNYFVVLRYNGDKYELVEDIQKNDYIVFPLIRSSATTIDRTKENGETETVLDGSNIELKYKEGLVNTVSTESDVTNTTGEQTDLNILANVYETFIKSIADTEEAIDKNGNEYDKFIYDPIYYNDNGEQKKFMFPRIKEEKIKNTEIELDKKSYDAENRNFVIGPITMSGSTSSVVLTKSDGTRDVYDFAKLENFKITANTTTETDKVLARSEWQFMYNGSIQDTTPSADTPFYIIIPDKEGEITEVTGITFDYSYLISVANYYYFSDGVTSAGKEAQEQAMIRDAARWYETIEVNALESSTSLNIYKKAVDEDGNELSADEVAEKLGGEKQYAYFKVNIDYNGAKDANGNVIQNLDKTYEVEAGGDPIVIPVQKWVPEDSVHPTYTVKEVTSDGQELNDNNDARWKVKRIENSSGSLEGKSTVRIVGTNQLKSHDGKLKITKKVQYENGEEVKLEQATTFTFKLDILRKSDGKIVGSEDIELTVDANKSTASKESNSYKWYGDDVLEYKLTETDSKGYISDGVKEGTLEAGNTVEVTYNNTKETPKPVTLTIKKTVKAGEDGIETNERFTFRIRTEGAENNFGNTSGGYVPIVLNADQEAIFTFYPISSTEPVKYWVYEEIASDSKTVPAEFTVSKDGEIIADSDENISNSSESIAKIDIPANRPENGWYAIVEGKTLSGGESVRVEAINKQIIPTEGHLKLTKEFSKASTKDRVAIFKVTVEVPKDVNLETSPTGFVPDITTVYTSPDNAEATHYVKYVAGFVKAGDNEVTRWITHNDIFNWSSNVIEGTTWNSGDFKWLGDYELKYHIEEEQVFEVDLSNQKAENVTNQYTSVISTPAGNTEGRGILSEDENLNLVHAYNGDKIVTLNVVKELDENGKIDNDQEFKFDVKVEGVTKVITNNGGIDENRVFTDKPSVSVNKPVTYVFEYEGDEAPTFEVKEIDNENLESITITPSDAGKVENNVASGSLIPGAEVAVTAKNKLKIYKNIAITKRISGPADTDEIFVFEVTVGNETERAEITIKKDETTGKTWTSKEYDCTDSNLTYSIKEIEVWSVDKDGNRTDITGKYSPSINPSEGVLGDQVEHTIDVQAFNNENAHQPIQLKKTFTEELKNPVEVTMKVEVTAPEGGFTKVPEGFDKETGGTKEITLTIGKDQKEQTWSTEGDFYWNAEGYSLTENTKIKEIKVDGKPIEESNYVASEATLDWIDSLPIWEIVNTKKNEGYLKLTKTTSEKLTNTEIFVFTINIGDKTTYIAEKVLKGTDTVDSWMDVPAPNENVDYITLFNESEWTKGAWESEHKLWSINEEAPTYRISEEVKSYKVENDGSITPEENKYFSNLPVEGVLENGEITVEAINTKKEDNMATLKIVKKLSNAQDLDKEFTFDINVDGITEYYQNGKWTQATSFSTGENGIKISVNNPSEQYQFKFAEGTKPTYKVTERTGDTYTIEDISTGNAEETKTDENGNKFVEGNLEVGKDITITATNKLKIYKNIAITKTISGPADTDEIFVFKVKVGEDEETAEITIKKGETTGETWTSKEYDCTDSKPTYSIEEIEVWSVDENGKHIEDLTGKYNPSITPNSGTLGDQVEHTIDVKAFNNENYHQPIQIKKTFKKELEKQVEVKVKVTVTAPNGGFTKFPEEFELVDGKYTKEVSLTIGKNQTEQSWASNGEFYWKDAAYSLTANTSVEEIQVIEDGTNVVDRYEVNKSIENIDNLPVWDIVNTENKKGKLTIKKTVAGKADTDEIFEFKVTIGGKEQTVYLKVKAGDEAASSYSYDKENWQDLTDGKWISEEVTWKTTESAPSYSISEIYVEGYKPVFKSNDTSGSYNEATKTYTGTLKAGSSIDGTIDVDIQNNKTTTNEDYYAQLNIKKLVKGNTNKEGIFKFKVTVEGVTENLSGRGNINGDKFTDEVTVAPNATSGTYKFKYTGNDAPKFTVEEYEGSGYELESITSNAEDSNRDGNTIKGTLKGSDDENDNSNLITVVATNKVEFSNKIIIRKTLDGGPAGTNEKFTFNVTVTDSDGNKKTETAEIRVSKGETTGTWTSDKTYTWYDENKAPTYEISDEKAFQVDSEWKNDKDITAKYNPQGLPKKGTLDGSSSEITVDVVNYTNVGSGPLVIKKEWNGENSVTNKFKFNVTITEVDGIELIDAVDGKIEVQVELAPGEEWTEFYKWTYTGSNTNITPSFEIKEIDLPAGTKIDNIKIDNNTGTQHGNIISGNLKNTDKVSDGRRVTFINTANKENWGKIKVTKDFLNDKELPDSAIKANAASRNDSFKVLITVKPNNGSLIYEDEIYEKELKIPAVLSSTGNWTFETEEIYWTSKNNAPSFTIEEISNSPAWSYVKGELDGNTDTTNLLTGSLVNKQTKSATITNKPRRAIILTMELGGMVWEDIARDGTKTDDYNGKPNGVYDGLNDKLKPNIEVNVYKRIYENGTYKDKIPVAITRTESDGRWLVSRLGVPVATKNDLVRLGIIGSSDSYDSTKYTADYDVEFAYDGQTYKPTDSVIYWDNGSKVGNASDFKSLKDTEEETKRNRAKYANSSMAKETENNSEKITEVKGNMPIDDNGTTVGTVVTDNGNESITYQMTETGYPLISELQTTYGDNENVYDVVKATATTSAAELTFPFEQFMSLSPDEVTINLDEDLYINTAADLIGVATHCWDDIVNGTLIGGRTYTYAGTSIPPRTGTIDCSSFISYVLYEYGYTGEFAGWQKATPWFVTESNLASMKTKYNWQYFKINGGQNANDVVEGGIKPGDIVVRDNGAGGAYGHITFVKAVSGNGTTNRTYTLYDCGAQTNWTNPNNKNGITRKSSFIESDSRSGYVIRIGENRPVTIERGENGNKLEIEVSNNSIYKLYEYQDGAYTEISEADTENGKTYYLKNSIANYVIDNAGNYIVPKDSIYVKVTKIDNKYTINMNENFIVTDNYKAIYNYCKNINLGLVEKKDVDIGLTKNLSTVKVVVKENLYQFNYSQNYDLTEEKIDSLSKDIKVNGVTEILPMDIGLYKSDYNYRAEIYNNDGTVYDKLSTLYKTFNKTLDDTEMDIYLTYNIKVKNSSSDYNVTINSIDDYYDETLEFVKDYEKKYIKKETIGTGGTPVEVNKEEVVATHFSYSDKWSDVEYGIKGSDGITYNKMTAKNLGIELNPGQNSTITMTFKVKSDKYDPHEIILGQKANVAEISNYSTWYSKNSNGSYNYAGKIDRDSAPGNVNIRKHNDKTWYEDDTFAAPIASIIPIPETQNGQRNISGSVWEDKKNVTDSDYKHGNGTKDSEEKAIQGMTTELVEKVMIPNSDGGFTAYDFVWPTDKAIDSLGGRTIQQATGFDSTTTTQGDKGTYEFNNIPTGDYVVRFTYGDGNETKTTNYSTAQFYNGQDFKSSIYNLKDGDTETKLNLDKYNYLVDEKNKLVNDNYDKDDKNVAVDSEVRRLQVIQKSREITNENGKVLASAYNDNYKQYKNELFKDYYMYADTPIISFDDLSKTYNIKNIDFALEERPLTELSLDKQIKEIRVTTSDGQTLMDAVYKITYDISDKGKITANVKLDETKSTGTENLQALDRDLATNQGFRYINVDSEILQGATITVTYQLSAINSGEVDYTGKLAEGEWTAETFHNTCDTLSTNLATYDKDKKPKTSQGTYVGHAYYYGTKGNDDQPVKTSVKELVDYVDNDMTFDAALNSAQNTSWKTTTEFELKGLVENNGTILDSNDVSYSTNGNLITSINDVSKNGIVGEELETVRNENEYTPQAQIQLTISKFVSADSDTLQIDNIAEIIRYTNTVGRRDILTTTGNTNPAEAIKKVSTGGNNGPISKEMNYERDTSATELITLSPSTGSSIFIWRLQVAGAITAAMVIVAGGIVLIKKKVLK